MIPLFLRYPTSNQPVSLAVFSDKYILNILLNSLLTPWSKQPSAPSWTTTVVSWLISLSQVLLHTPVRMILGKHGSDHLSGDCSEITLRSHPNFSRALSDYVASDQLLHLRACIPSHLTHLDLTHFILRFLYLLFFLPGMLFFPEFLLFYSKVCQPLPL